MIRIEIKSGKHTYQVCSGRSNLIGACKTLDQASRLHDLASAAEAILDGLDAVQVIRISRKIKRLLQSGLNKGRK